MIKIILTILLGIISGTITGLLPGIHNNLVTTILLSSTIIYKIPTNIAIVYIVSLSITHTFTDFIPSIYFFSISPDTAIVSTPGQKLFSRGLGHLAINNTIKGSIIAIFAFLIILIPFVYFIPKIYDKIEIMFPWILFWVIIISIYRTKNRCETILIILCCGLLGFFTLNSTIKEPLTPLLTGFFGISTLIYSKENQNIEKQNIYEEKYTIREITRIMIKTIIISPFCSLLPGLGASQASMLIPNKNTSDEKTMILLGSINTLVLSTSFITLFLINKTRSGASLAISQLTYLTTEEIKLIVLTILITSILSAKLTNILSKFISKRINKIDLKKIRILILIFVTILIFIVSKIYGILVYIIAILIGTLSIKLNVQKTNMMSCILIPTIIYYLPI